MSVLDITLSIAFLLSLFIKSSLKHFVLFLGVYWLVEIVITHWSVAQFGSNLLVYNLFVLFPVAYYLYVFCRSSREFVILFSIYFFGWLINFNQIDIHGELVSKNYAFGLIMVGVLVIREIKFKLESNLVDRFFEDSKFWLGISILLFLSCSFPILVFTDILVVSPSAHEIYRHLLSVGNVLLHLGFLMVIISETKWIRLLG